jgi:hypothetical protein
VSKVINNLSGIKLDFLSLWCKRIGFINFKEYYNYGSKRESIGNNEGGR